MTAKAEYSASCGCGRIGLEANAAPILSIICYCESCRTAARAFEQAPGAPRVLNPDGGVDYCLFRKDQVRIIRGAEHLQGHRLSDTSPTRRAVAACCNTPIFLDFTKGHWLTVYRDRLPVDAPPPVMGVMAKDLPVGSARPAAPPAYSGFPPKFMIRLLLAWVAMGFSRPAMDW